MARALRDLPVISDAFGSGTLSYSKARALIRVATPESEAGLVELAMHATAGQLERILAAWRRSRRTDADDVAAFAERYLRAHHDDEGTIKVIARLATDDGARFMAAVDAGAEILREQDRAVAEAARVSAETEEGTSSVSAETPMRTAEQRRADGPQHRVARARATRCTDRVVLDPSRRRPLGLGRGLRRARHVRLG